MSSFRRFSTTVTSLLEAFDVLFDRGAPTYPLPPELLRIYGGLGFSDHTMYANFVASIDGVVSLGSTPSAGSVISGRNPADRFLMGLLRACADAVVIGAGTLRATPGHQWTPAHVAPDFAGDFAVLRERLGRRPEPRLVVFSASGSIDAGHVALQKGATVITTDRTASALSRSLPASCEVIGIGSGDEVNVTQAIDALRTRGYEVLLTEGGPHVMGELTRQGMLDEVFLTISPVVAGRGAGERLGMVAGAELLPANGVLSRLVSVRSHGDYLFLRYRLLRR